MTVTNKGENSASLTQFYQAVGSAMTQWGIVENALRDLFTRLVACSITGRGMGPVHFDGYWVLGNVFFASTNLRARLQLLDLIFEKIVPDEELTKEWSATKNKALRLYKRRNILAHGMVWGHSEVGATHIAYSIFDDGSRGHLDYQQACAQTASFARLAERITRLAINTNAYLAANPRADLSLDSVAARKMGFESQVAGVGNRS
jgi:hypothetical protein